MNQWATFSYEGNRKPDGALARTRALLRSSYLSLASVRATFSSPGLRCLYCHNIFDDEVGHFRTICEELLRTGSFVDSQMCIEMLRGRVPIDRNYYHLSFDDGFRNLLTNGLPVLQDLMIPATIFVVTGLVGASYDVIREYCSTHWSVYANPIEMLSWSDISELQRYGVTIGSHTHTHARLSSLNNRYQFTDEILRPKQELEQRLGTRCDLISWPYGRLQDVSAKSLAFVREAGYSACFGGHRGTVEPMATNQFMIPRHHFETDWPLSHIRFFASGRRH